ncbi:hypothetical protein WG66_008965 [Moniliophthora roreri]|nr:hypothetical protein WG66_008965 [Moniliophthora roreri]
MIIIPGITAYRTGGSSQLLNAVYQDVVSMINVIVIVVLPVSPTTNIPGVPVLNLRARIAFYPNKSRNTPYP